MNSWYLPSHVSSLMSHILCPFSRPWYNKQTTRFSHAIPNIAHRPIALVNISITGNIPRLPQHRQLVRSAPVHQADKAGTLVLPVAAD